MKKTHKRISTVLVLILLSGAVIFAQGGSEPTAVDTGTTGGDSQPSELFGITLTRLPTDFQYPVQYTDAQWRKMLSAFDYKVLRQEGTESPWNNKYNDNHQKGIYYSKATGQPLFSSDAKYSSGTGWPSFNQPVSPDAVYLLPDYSYGMVRIEVVDSLSGSHLGHVFSDGPEPTGLRYCMNSTAMIFVPEGGTPPVVNPDNPPED